MISAATQEVPHACYFSEISKGVRTLSTLFWKIVSHFFRLCTARHITLATSVEIDVDKLSSSARSDPGTFPFGNVRHQPTSFLPRLSRGLAEDDAESVFREEWTVTRVVVSVMSLASQRAFLCSSQSLYSRRDRAFAQCRSGALPPLASCPRTPPCSAHRPSSDSASTRPGGT